MRNSIWTTEMQRVHGEDRIRGLQVNRASLFAVSAVTHALDAIRESQRCQTLGESQSGEYAPWRSLLDDYWQQFPGVASGALQEGLEAKMVATVEREIGPTSDSRILQAPGAESLMWATVYALSVHRPGNQGSCNAFTAAHSAYQCVFKVSAEPPDLSSELLPEVERRTPNCVAEVKWQVAVLQAIEGLTELVPYGELVRFL